VPTVRSCIHQRSCCTFCCNFKERRERERRKRERERVSEILRSTVAVVVAASFNLFCKCAEASCTCSFGLQIYLFISKKIFIILTLPKQQTFAQTCINVLLKKATIKKTQKTKTNHNVLKPETKPKLKKVCSS